MDTTITVLVENTASMSGLGAEHGFSVFVETSQGTLLWDTGQSRLFEANARALGIDLTNIDVIALSHGHYDHTGGLKHLLEDIGSRPIYGHEGIFRPRWSVTTQDGKRNSRAIGIPIEKSGYESVGAEFHLSTGPVSPVPGITLTGEIPRVTGYENPGGPFFLDMEGTIPDNIDDDQSLIVETEQGPAVILGCCHAGIVNTLTYIADTLNTKHFPLVMGGMHLLNADKTRMTETIEALHKFRIDRFLPGHCSGWKALCAFSQAFGDSVSPLMAGWRLSL